MDSCAIFYWSSLSMYFSYVPSIIFSFSIIPFSQSSFQTDPNSILFNRVLSSYSTVAALVQTYFSIGTTDVFECSRHYGYEPMGSCCFGELAFDHSQTYIRGQAQLSKMENTIRRNPTIQPPDCRQTSRNDAKRRHRMYKQNCWQCLASIRLMPNKIYRLSLIEITVPGGSSPRFA